jgi:opacity protein-like surface antigen
MGNLVVGIGGPVRPYATGGVGVIRASVDGLLGSATSNDFGMNFGGGVTGFFSDHVGLRGDVRFFRSVGDSSDLVDLDIDNVDFWRATIGAAVRW